MRRLMGSTGEALPAATSLARAVVRGLEPYAWEDSSEALATRYGLTVEDVVRFDTNTSPFPPVGLAEVLDRTRRAPWINEYVDTSYGAVTRSLAAYTGLSPQHLIVGAGADEVLDIIARTFLDNGDRVVTLFPTYAMYRIGAESMGATVARVPYGPAPTFALPVEAVLNAAKGAKIVYLCAPNNPTGVVPPLAELEALIAHAPCIVVVDEAYYEFCGQSVVAMVEHAAGRLIVVRTLSKAFSLAGGRLGYAVADPEIIELLNRVRPPNSVAYITTLLAEEALGRANEMRQRVATLLAERSRISEALGSLGLPPLPSSTNFLLIPLPDRQAAARAHEALRGQGLILRR